MPKCKSTRKREKKRMSSEFPRDFSPEKENSVTPGRKTAGSTHGSVLSAVGNIEASTQHLDLKPTILGAMATALDEAFSPGPPSAKKEPSSSTKSLDIDVSESDAGPVEEETVVEDVVRMTAADEAFMAVSAVYKETHYEVAANAAMGAPLLRGIDDVGLPLSDSDSSTPVAASGAGLASRTRERCSCFPLWKL